MSGVHDDKQHRRHHTPPMAASFLEFDLIRELEQLHREPDWNRAASRSTHQINVPSVNLTPAAG